MWNCRNIMWRLSRSSQIPSLFFTEPINSGPTTIQMPIGTPFPPSSYIYMLIVRCSWEPEENLEGCERLRESFWRHIGMDDRDYMVGYEVSASHAWIGWVHNSAAYIGAYPAFCIRQGKSFLQKRICLSAGRIGAPQEGTPRCKEGRDTNTFCAKTSLIDEIPLSGQETEIGNTQTRFDCRIFSLSEDLFSITRLWTQINTWPEWIVWGWKTSSDYCSTAFSSKEKKGGFLAIWRWGDRWQFEATKVRKIEWLSFDCYGRRGALFTHLEGPVNNNLVKDALPRADSPTSLFSVPSSPEIPLIDSLLSSVPTMNTSSAAHVPSTAMNFPQQPNPHAQYHSEPTSGGGGISIKQRLGIGALAPTNPKTGALPLSMRPPMPKPLPPSFAGLKIKKIPSLSISTNANPASGHEPPLGSASIHSPHPTTNMSPNIPNLTPSTSAPVFTPNFYRHVYVFFFFKNFSIW